VTLFAVIDLVGDALLLPPTLHLGCVRWGSVAHEAHDPDLASYAAQLSPHLYRDGSIAEAGCEEEPKLLLVLFTPMALA